MGNRTNCLEKRRKNWQLRKYLDLYPNGRHRNEAKTRRDVNEAFTTTHFDLDKWLKSDDNDGINSKIIITNRAECGITVKFSGPSTKK